MISTSSSEGLYNEARLAHEAGSYRDAIELLEKSVKISEHFKARELLGVCFGEIGDIGKAIENLELAYRMNEKSSKTACLLAQLLLNSGNLSRCKEIVERVLQNHLDYGPAKRLLNELNAR